jgi:predicted ferric reductase
MQQVPWYIARSAGLVSWALLTASVLWGLAISTKALGKRVRPNWLLDLHRYLGGLASIFVAVHVLAIVADSYVHFDLVSVLMPFASSWKPGPVAWGVVAMYLLAAIELTSLARRRLPKRVWRMTHMASFPLFFLATIHGFTAGTDAHTLAFVAIASTAVVAVGSLTAWRIVQLDEPAPARVRVTSARRAAGA